MTVPEILSELRINNVIPKLTGNQIVLVGKTEELPEEIIAIVKEEKEALIEYLKETYKQLDFESIAQVEKQKYYPCSNAQRRMGILYHFDGAEYVYNITANFYLKGIVKHTELEEAFRLSVIRHESLRTVFKEIDGILNQEILENISINVSFCDVSGSPGKEEFLLSEIDKSYRFRFDMAKGPLFIVKLIQLSHNEYAMLLTMHHIISDGWSVEVLLKEVLVNYKKLCNRDAGSTSPLTVQYKDYAAWLEYRLNTERSNDAMDFWKSQFPSTIPVLTLPYDFKRPSVVSFEGAVLKNNIDPDILIQIHSFCKENHLTVFNFLRAVITILLAKFSRQDYFVIGIPVSGRILQELEGQIGLYTNTLPLGIKIDQDYNFLDFLHKVSESTSNAFEFQEYPLDRIIDKLAVKRQPGRSPMFDVMLVLQNTNRYPHVTDLRKQHGFEMDLLDTYLDIGKILGRKVRASKLDLTFNFDFDLTGNFYIEIEYATTLFTEKTIQKFYTAFNGIITQVLNDPGIQLAQISLVSENEKEILLHRFNSPIRGIEEFNIMQLLISSFVKFPDKTAIKYEDKAVTYSELLDSLTGVVGCLVEQVPEKNALVGLLTERSERTISTILGILHSGAAYVPIDINYPLERIAYIVADAGLKYLIVDRDCEKAVPKGFSGKIIYTEDLYQTGAKRAFIPSNDDLREHVAYIIYTSGSTGQPKGVEICHRNTIAFLNWAAKEFIETPFEILYAGSSYSFDLSIFEFFVPLILGKAIRIVNSAVNLPDYVQEDKNIFINTVPSVVANLLFNKMSWSNVVALNIAGEVLTKNIVQELDFNKIEIRNLYGPTEDTTYSTVYRITTTDLETVPIGKPIENTHLYILDDNLNFVPENVEGEIYLAGQSTAKGYINKPNLTSEKFLQNPFVKGCVMYKTGDTGKWRPDGNIEFIGRTDDQVKIRGHRIEPGEIKNKLESHPLVQQSVVRAIYIDNEIELVAYWTGDDKLSRSMLKEYILLHLPAYMLPVYWVKLLSIPLTANGKVDFKNLPHPVLDLTERAVAAKPMGAMQHKLYSLWRELLPKTEFGVNDNFFDIGGNSLSATRLRFLIESQLGIPVSLNNLFRYTTIVEQCAFIEQNPAGAIEEIKTGIKCTNYPISYAQQRLWVLTGFEEASIAYHMPVAFKITGDLDVNILTQAFTLVFEKHEILRTVFANINDEPFQRILPIEELHFSIEQIRTEKELSPSHLTAFLNEKWKIAFDFMKCPILTCFILHHGTESILSFNMHHIISDGWSIDVLTKDIIYFYRALVDRTPVNPAVLKMQYKDFVVWQRDKLSAGAIKDNLEFWMSEFRETIPVLNLPTDFSRPDVKTYTGSVNVFRIEDVQFSGIKKLTATAKASLFMTVLALVNILLKKYSDQNDIVLGIPVSGRSHHQLEDQIGLYANTLPIRTKIDPDMPFISFLAEQKGILLKALEHQDLPFEILLNNLAIPRDISRSPLFDVMLVLENSQNLNSAATIPVTPNLQFDRLWIKREQAKYDLTFYFIETEKSLLLEIEYNTALFNQNTISRMADHLSCIIDQVVFDPVMKIKDISLLREEERNSINANADQNAMCYDTSATIISLFQQAVKKFGNKTAIYAGSYKLSYDELDKRSSQLASVLIDKYDVKPESLVLLFFERTEWMLIAIFAVLKAGAAYVPIDPSYPESRVNYIINDTESGLILYETEPGDRLRAGWPNLNFVNVIREKCINTIDTFHVNPDNLAYVIYTSGTTGNPKGVMIEHRNVVRLLFNDLMPYDFNSSDKWVLFHSYCFDVSVWEIFGSLLYGGALYIIPKDTIQDSLVFYDFLLREKITVLNQTPTAFRSLTLNNQHRFLTSPADSVRFLIFAGEPLMPEIIREWKRYIPACRNINMYGITETTVHVTFKEIGNEEISKNISNIGLPLPTLSCYVLDKDLQMVPAGIIGELCVGGEGLSRGYLKKPELTREKFIDSPLCAGRRLYRSGDYARMLPSGEIEYIGRRDHQVKIRGHRIELNEINIALSKIDLVKDAIVLSRTGSSGENELIAYYISDSDLHQDDLRKELGKMVPSYMIPSYFMQVAFFPTNSNGKLDRVFLPDPKEAIERTDTIIPARNSTDANIIAIWEDILEKKNIGIKDNFFNMGGHSLKAIRVISKILEIYEIKLDLKILFQNPTIEHLSNCITLIQQRENQMLLTGEDEEEITI